MLLLQQQEQEQGEQGPGANAGASLLNCHVIIRHPGGAGRARGAAVGGAGGRRRRAVGLPQPPPPSQVVEAPGLGEEGAQVVGVQRPAGLGPHPEGRHVGEQHPRAQGHPLFCDLKVFNLCALSNVYVYVPTISQNRDGQGIRSTVIDHKFWVFECNYMALISFCILIPSVLDDEPGAYSEGDAAVGHGRVQHAVKGQRPLGHLHVPHRHRHHLGGEQQRPVAERALHQQPQQRLRGAPHGRGRAQVGRRQRPLHVHLEWPLERAQQWPSGRP
mmetsp:Transcript_24334/g.33638  ORF Transcript_24334/g.33638 Transcript_24334/m.33638 type:complete len:273 (-) Transcript_24334:701-1519(-)